jgi:3-oxoacid CoA-transferase subunit A
MKPIFLDAREALADRLQNGMTLCVGGFGLCGIPERLIEAVEMSGVTGLTVVSNNAGIDGIGLGRLLRTRQIARMVASYVGENREFERQALAGEIEVEFVPQGTLAERCRAGGAGIPAFYTMTGVGTLAADGKEVRRFADKDYLLEQAIVADVSLVKAWRADRAGNLLFRLTARNFNQPMAAAGRICIAEVEDVVETGDIPPDAVHLPGIFVDALVHAGAYEKHIEFRTLREEVTR